MAYGNLEPVYLPATTQMDMGPIISLRVLLLSLSLTSLCVGSVRAEVSYERLKNAKQEPHNWLTYSGDYAGQRYSALEQINRRNVNDLRVQWIFQTGLAGPFESTPLVVDGIMYVTALNNRVYALDAVTGRLIWRYERSLPERISLCCGRINRGVAALGSKIFLATLDAHVIALDAKTGNVVWEVKAADYSKAETFTLAPLAVKDKIIVGVSGGDFGNRGFIEAYEAESGKRVWRFYTVPGPGEPGSESWDGDSWKTGGGPAWVTGTYDPELNLIYWGTGNPGSALYGKDRKGDNLYTNCVVALDAQTGKRKWHFQFTPHDVHDWDATQVPVLLDLDFDGVPRKLLVEANRNGFFYVLDRTDGRFLLAKNFGKVTWAKGVDAGGRPILLPDTDPTPEGNYICPGAWGVTNWMSPSYSPQTGLFYVAAREQCDVFTSAVPHYEAGAGFFGSTANPPPKQKEKDSGAFRAIDPLNGEVRWEFGLYSAPFGGMLSTAGGLVFAGDMEGYLIALDALTGKDLWHFQTGASIYAAPIAYALNGKQYLAIPSGGALLTLALPDDRMAPGTSGQP
jgi:alcohol dehydrogenase (cytochrome c)